MRCGYGLAPNAKECDSTGLTAPGVAIIVPVLNEAAGLPDLIAHLEMQPAEQVIVVDGGSTDGTFEGLSQLQIERPDTKLCVVQSRAGRARQMNVGSEHAACDTLLFLHADSRLPAGACAEAANAKQWGRFDIEFDSSSPAMRVIAFFINWRSRLTGVATGDQALFIPRKLFEHLGGFPDLPLMEDVALCKQLRQHSAPYCSILRVQTSARRWQQHGVIKTVLLMWWFRFAFWLGVSPAILKRRYDDVR